MGIISQAENILNIKTKIFQVHPPGLQDQDGRVGDREGSCRHVEGSQNQQGLRWKLNEKIIQYQFQKMQDYFTLVFYN